LQNVYGKHFNISGGASPSPTKSYARSYTYYQDRAFFEESMLEQLHWYTHENINTLSVRKMFSAVLVIYLTVLL